MIHKVFSFNLQKTTFFGQVWQPLKIKAVVILIHGMGEYSSRYTTSIIPNLIKNNFSVVSFDQFGHGKTTGKRGHNPNFNAIMDSIFNVILKAKGFFPKLPIFLYGHSMGGNCVINYILRKENDIKGVISSSPFLKLAFKPPMRKMIVGKIMQKIYPSFTLNSNLNPNFISRNPKEVQKYINDKMIHNRISPNFSISMIESGKWALNKASFFKTQMLIVHGNNDKIIDYKASIEFAKKSKTTQIKIYNGGYHELHNDLCKDEVLNDISNWLNKQL